MSAATPDEQCTALVKDKTRRCSLAVAPGTDLCYVHSGVTLEAARASRESERRREYELRRAGYVTLREKMRDTNERERRLLRALRVLHRGLRSKRVAVKLEAAKLSPTLLDALGVIASVDLAKAVVLLLPMELLE